MTVRELKEILEDFNENDEVVVVKQGQDYTRTMHASGIDSCDELTVKDDSYCSAYFQGAYGIVDDDDINDEALESGDHRRVIGLYL